MTLERMLRKCRNAGALLVAAVSACGAPDDRTDDPARVAKAALAVPGLTPVPCASGAWLGSTVDVLVADAWAGCSADSADPNGSYTKEYFGTDAYLNTVFGYMANALGKAPTDGNYFRAWVELRSDKAKNCDPVSGSQATSAVQIPRMPVPERIDTIPIPGDKERYRAANADLRQAGINLCIAQRVRALTPGSSAGEALLLSDSDQRFLLEMIRERSQVAMLQYALLGVVFATETQTFTKTPSISQRIPILQAWAGDPDNFGNLQTMGRDFAAAVQLHSAVSEELLRLLARSRSARSPRGGLVEDRADETWGPGSWMQRLASAAFGGDPLVVVDHRTPWRHWNPNQHVGGEGAICDGFPLDWPTSRQRPYASTHTSTPQVAELLRLARSFDRIELFYDDALPTCALFDVEKSATALYKNVEGELRVRDCFRTNSSDPCPGSAVPARK